MPKRRLFTAITVGVLLAAMVAPASAAPVASDLNLWTAYDQPYGGTATVNPAVWVVVPDGTSATETVNGRPTFLVSPDSADGHRITARVDTVAFDDDFFGFALGFDAAPSADYLLIDWKQGPQSVNWREGAGTVYGGQGLAVSRVTGVPTLAELWAHFDWSGNASGAVTELARGSTLGAVGWSDDNAYDFVIEYTTTSLDVWVDGSHEITLTGDFPAGPFALYNFSQPGIGFSEITFEDLNRPPAVDGSGAADVDVLEGQTGTTSGAFVDPDGDALSLSCSGSCSGFSDDGAGAWSWSQVEPEGPHAHTVTVTASDGEFEAIDSFDVTVHNVAPVITSTSALPGLLANTTAFVVSAGFTDVGVLDIHTALFEWGDGSSSLGAIAEASGAGVAEATHQYADPGVYTITVTVWDDDGDLDTATVGVVRVFDPDDFVTGGGWIDSPAGALVSDPDHEGKTTFGFVARYRKDGSVHGSLQVQVHKELNFHATSFDTLFILNGVAEFTGGGKVNGVPGYTFKVVAIDERHAASPDDLFWIEITGPRGNVYGGSALDPGEPIVGKGIQVHDKD